jgi:gliding motility-associated lipoprotein GldD
MYPKVDFPKGENIIFNNDYCNLQFEFPSYGITEKDEFFFDEKPTDPCWFDIRINSLNADLHCSYSPITKANNFDKLVNDAFKLAGKHNIKADYRKESLIHNPDANVYGLLFMIEGPVATPIQFYLTDSTEHFFRASLYYNDKVDPDSTQIITDFLFNDVEHMIETFSWKE